MTTCTYVPAPRTWFGARWTEEVLEVREVVNSTFITLDGVIEDPHLWPTTGDDGGEGEALHTELLLASDAVLMGRRTYESFAPAWSARSGDPFSDRINMLPKYVVSTTLTEPEWNNTTVIGGGDVAAAVTELKSQDGQGIVQYGFGLLSSTLLEHGLLDELRLWVHPFMIGDGGVEAVIFRESRAAAFQLADVKSLKGGVVLLVYRTA
jgi:dihydrofolate reductase